MSQQKTIRFKYKSGDTSRVTIKRYKSGDFGIFRKNSWNPDEKMSFISPLEFELMVKLHKASQTHGGKN